MRLQKRLAADVLKCSDKRIRLDPGRLDEIKEAITKADIKGLINKGAIKGLPVKGSSKVRARKIASQRRKGRRKGHGSRKGKHNARADVKGVWMCNVRAQRWVLKNIRDKGHISTGDYRSVYAKVKGGFFRSVRHLKMFMEEQGFFK